MKKSRFENHCWDDIMDKELLDIAESYEREIHIGKKPALLLVDLYNLVYDGGPRPVQELLEEFPSSCGINAWNAIEPTKKLISIARSNELPLFYCTRGKGRVKATFRQRNVVSENSYEIKDEFRPEEEDFIIHKERASCFYGTPLNAYLTQLGIDTVMICGEATSGCVRATAVDAYSHGFHTVVVEECTFDQGLLTHKLNLFDLHLKYADVMKLEEVEAHFCSR